MWGSQVEIERRRRIKVALWAYAYEIMCDSLVSDHVFDKECALIDVTLDTGHPILDTWFREQYDKCTGNWIHSHPEKDKIAKLYEEYKRGFNTRITNLEASTR